MKKVSINGYKRINKTQAKNLYKNNKEVYLLPSNVRIGSKWIKPTKIKYNDNVGDAFDSICNEYQFYNCNSEVGKNIWFYMRED